MIKMIEMIKMIKVQFGILLSVSSIIIIINGVNGFGCKCEPNDKK